MGWGGSKTGIGRLRTRLSLRIRVLMPWSASEHERGVDSVGEMLIHDDENGWEVRESHLPCRGISLRCKRKRARKIWTCNDIHSSLK